jgi:hypothetical protein
VAIEAGTQGATGIELRDRMMGIDGQLDIPRRSDHFADEETGETGEGEDEAVNARATGSGDKHHDQLFFFIL